MEIVGKPKMYRWTIEIEVSDNWVADGFTFGQPSVYSSKESDELSEEMRANFLPYAYPHEVRARIIKAPKAEDIAQEQGFKS